MMKLPERLLEKLKEAEGDVALCSLLAENGVDPEEFEKSLPEDVLEQVQGGTDETRKLTDCICPNCGNADRDELSRQFWLSWLIIPDGCSAYRCRKCDTYFRVAWF